MGYTQNLAYIRIEIVTPTNDALAGNYDVKVTAYLNDGVAPLQSTEFHIKFRVFTTNEICATSLGKTNIYREIEIPDYDQPIIIIIDLSTAITPLPVGSIISITYEVVSYSWTVDPLTVSISGTLLTSLKFWEYQDFRIKATD